MQTFDQSIFGLYEKGYVSYEEALRWATNIDEFKLKVQGIQTTADTAREKMARETNMANTLVPKITRFGS
jgi:twitching motility protein PilT